jgi:hypothetical protein
MFVNLSAVHTYADNVQVKAYEAIVRASMATAAVLIVQVTSDVNQPDEPDGGEEAEQSSED